MTTFFMTGTDTDVGKTYVASCLLAAAARLGYRSLGLKPVAAGCEQTADGLRNADALSLMAASSIKLSYDEINPIALEAACAPHIAAAIESRQLNAQRLVGLLRGSLSHRPEFALVEGAGGWRVPLNSREFMSAIPKQLNMPVILVINLRLGCLNAALLSAEAILKDGLQLAGWIANSSQQAMDYEQENVATLKHWLPAPCLAEFPFEPNQNDQKVQLVAEQAVLALLNTRQA
jgi:dethiobiotin synthetase